MLAAVRPPRAPGRLAPTAWGPAWDLGPPLLGRVLPWGLWQRREVWGAAGPPSTRKPTVKATEAAAGARGPCQVFGGIGPLRALVLVWPPEAGPAVSSVLCLVGFQHTPPLPWAGGLPCPASAILAPSDCGNHFARL